MNAKRLRNGFVAPLSGLIAVRSNAGRQPHRSLRAAGLATALVLTTPYLMADDTPNPIVVDANAAPCVSTTPAHHFMTITAAIGYAPAGATIVVCPGNYAEQITIGKSLTLRGVTNTAANTGAAIITAPAGGLSPNFPSAMGTLFGPVAAQVLVQGTGTNVILNNIAVDGTGAFPPDCASTALVGIGFDTGSSGTLRRVAVRNQNVPICGFLGIGGIGVFAATGSSLTLLDSSIHDFEFSGVLAAGTVVVKTTVFNRGSGSLTGSGPLDGACFFAAGGSAQFTNNTVMNCTGVDFLGTSGGTVTGNTIVGTGIVRLFCSTMTVSGNNIANADTGISLISFGVGGLLGSTLQHNDISSVRIGIDLGIAGTSLGNNVSYNTIDEAGRGIIGTIGNNVSNNTFLNVTTLTEPSGSCGVTGC